MPCLLLRHISSRNFWKPYAIIIENLILRSRPLCCPSDVKIQFVKIKEEFEKLKIKLNHLHKGLGKLYITPAIFKKIILARAVYLLQVQIFVTWPDYLWKTSDKPFLVASFEILTNCPRLP